VPTTKSTLFVVSKDEWDTKKDTGKSIKNALHVQWAKGTSQAEATLNSEKHQARSLSHCCLKASGRQAVSQSVENSVK